MEVGGEAIDDLSTPAIALLRREDVAADFPVVEDKLSVGGERGLDLGGADALFDARDEPLV